MRLGVPARQDGQAQKNNTGKGRKEDGGIRRGEVEKEREPKRRSAGRGEQMEKQKQNAKEKNSIKVWERRGPGAGVYHTLQRWDRFPLPLPLPRPPVDFSTGVFFSLAVPKFSGQAAAGRGPV